MPRLNIGELPWPPRRYRIDKLPPDGDGRAFESLIRAEEEDALRARLLRTAGLSSAWQALQAGILARRLEPCGQNWTPPESMASATYMRGQRIKVPGWLWKLCVEGRWTRVVTVTLLPATWVIKADDLDAVNPVHLLETVRADLNRKGAAKAKGWLVLFLHGEDDPASELIRLHLHGLAADGMVDVLDRLRKLKKYRSKRSKRATHAHAADKPIKISRKPITNLPTTITYILQSFWPGRWIGDVGDGRLRKRRSKCRIPEPTHSQVLLWLDKHKLQDIALIMKIDVTKHGFKHRG